jgi:hypothetical protein
MGEVHEGGEGLHYTLVPSKKKKMMMMMNIFHNSSYENLEERGEGSSDDHVQS